MSMLHWYQGEDKSGACAAGGGDLNVCFFSVFFRLFSRMYSDHDCSIAQDSSISPHFAAIYIAGTASRVYLAVAVPRIAKDGYPTLTAGEHAAGSGSRKQRIVLSRNLSHRCGGCGCDFGECMKASKLHVASQRKSGLSLLAGLSVFYCGRRGGTSNRK